MLLHPFLWKSMWNVSLHIILTIIFLLYTQQALPPRVSYLNTAGSWARAGHTCHHDSEYNAQGHACLHDSEYNAQGHGKEKSTIWPYQQLQS